MSFIQDPRYSKDAGMAKRVTIETTQIPKLESLEGEKSSNIQKSESLQRAKS